MTETPKDQETELKDLKKELSRLRLEANLRKSLATQLEKQKKVAEDAKAEAQSKTQQMEDVSGQLAKYLSPQIYESIFSGKQNVEVKSYRKKITVFFSDIVNFTAISDKLESEELTALLNFYLNEMSQIALKHGATIDKYIGDAIMIFFGDPESFGIEEDMAAFLESRADFTRVTTDAPSRFTPDENMDGFFIALLRKGR